MASQNTDTDPDHVARTAVRHAVHHVLLAVGGSAALVQRPISPTLSTQHTVPADYLAGISAAHTIAGHANQLLTEYARGARGAGRTWLELAAALRVPAEHEDRAVAAFEIVAGPPRSRFDTRYVAWRCESCAALVADRGPYENHPVDNESGHAEDCARHRAEIADYQATADF